jgi:RNA recognition motif-containing protein
MSSSEYQFIGPLKPGQKPPPPPVPGEYNHNWSVLDLLNDAQASASKSQIGKIKKPKKILRAAGGTTWEDPSLAEWDPDDYRVFCGDLGNDVTDELLTKTFEKYPSFVKAKVVRDKRTNKSKGYGFISFKDSQDYARAIKEWDGKYLGNRPIKLRKSQWKDRLLEVRKNKVGSITPDA